MKVPDMKLRRAITAALGLALAAPAGAQILRTPQQCKTFAGVISAMALDHDYGDATEEESVQAMLDQGVTEISPNELQLEARRIWRGDLARLTSAQIEGQVYRECLARPEK
jgi:hypothetical protein